jgi:hypothetical protein
MNYIIGVDEWRKVYASGSNHKIVWIVIEISDGNTIYLDSYNKWLSLKTYCQDKKVRINSIGLQYKTNLIKTDTSDKDGVYLIRSVKGQMGGTSRDCFTIGVVNSNKVNKTIWLTPELVEDSSYEDDLKNCFEEAIIYNN